MEVVDANLPAGGFGNRISRTIRLEINDTDGIVKVDAICLAEERASNQLPGVRYRLAARLRLPDHDVTIARMKSRVY